MGAPTTWLLAASMVVTGIDAPADASPAASVTVLGMEGDASRSASLTDALRRALAEQGLQQHANASLAEVRLIGACDQTTVVCVAQGAAQLDADRVIYGQLDPSTSDTLSVTVRSIEVATGQELASVTQTVARADFDTHIDAVARSLLVSLRVLPEPKAEPLTPSTQRSSTPLEDPRFAHETTPDKTLVWGAYAPRPAWKWALLGTSVGLTVIGIGGAVAFTVRRRAIEDDLSAAITASQTPSPLNQDPPIAVSNCDEALQMPEPDKVFNAEVGNLCERGRFVTNGANAMTAVAALGFATSVLATVLLHVRRTSLLSARVTPTASRSHGGLSVHGRF